MATSALQVHHDMHLADACHLHDAHSGNAFTDVSLEHLFAQ